MIMRRATELLGTTAFLASLFLFAGPMGARSVDAGDQKQGARRVNIANARPAKRSVKPRRSMISQAATGKALAQAPPKPLDGSLVQGDVRRVGFLEDFHGFPSEPGCGCGEVICDCGEAVCGVEPGCGVPVGCDCGYGDQCSCGVEAGCGIEIMEPSCEYVEPGCGFVEPGCGFVEPGCGFVEPGCGAPACGSEIVDCGCDSCAADCSPGCPIFLPYLRIDWRRFDFFAGTQGFKGPANYASINANNPNQRIGSGSFGFYQGFNEGRSLNPWLGADLAAQFGLRATQSNLSGADFTSDTRQQIFLTGGFFRRVDFGLQLGLVVDYLHDEWYFQTDLAQLRGECSWNTGGVLTYGFQYMVGVNSNQSRTSVRDLNGNTVVSMDDFEATDQYRIFLRRKLNGCGSYSGFAGWTEGDDGLIGSLFDIPLNRTLLLNTGATYLIPREGNENGGNQQESWNISLGVTWRPCGISRGRYSRPMFDVADNGTFIVTRR